MMNTRSFAVAAVIALVAVALGGTPPSEAIGAEDLRSGLFWPEYLDCSTDPAAAVIGDVTSDADLAQEASGHSGSSSDCACHYFAECGTGQCTVSSDTDRHPSCFGTLVPEPPSQSCIMCFDDCLE